MIRSKESERELNLIDKALSDKQAEILADVQEMGDRLVAKDLFIKVLRDALQGMLDGYKRGATTILEVENAHIALVKTEK